MAECLYDISIDLEGDVPARLTLSSKKYYCHFCRCNCSVTLEDLRCTACRSQFVEEVTPETNLDGYGTLQKEPSTQPLSDDYGFSSGPTNLQNNRRHVAQSPPEIPILRRYQHESLDSHCIGSTGPANLHSNRRHAAQPLPEMPVLRRYPNELSDSHCIGSRRRADRPADSSNSSTLREPPPLQPIPRIPTYRRRSDTFELPNGDRRPEFPQDIPSEEDEDHDSDESEIDLETVSPLSEENLSDLIRRTIRRTILDFEQREGYPSQYFRQALEATTERLPMGERAPEPEERNDVMPVIAEISNNMNPRSFHELFQLASHLGDYAFGGEWDSIITQILNDAEISGSPPLDSKKIEAIPKISIHEEDVLNSLQCTICLEDFQINEMVKNLPCTHMFHDDCIVPWLQLHDTCPICRKQINME